MGPYIDDMSWQKGSQNSYLAARSSGGRDRVGTCMVASEGRRGSVESQASRCGFASMFQCKNLQSLCILHVLVPTVGCPGVNAMEEGGGVLFEYEGLGLQARPLLSLSIRQQETQEVQKWRK